MEYILNTRDLEVIEEMKAEASAKLNADVNQYLTAVIRQQKLPPQPYGYVLDETNTKLIPAVKL